MNALKVSLENWVENLEANRTGIVLPLLELIPELFCDFIEYSARVALTAKGLMAIVVVAVEVLSNELGDELDVDDGDLQFLPVHLVIVLLWQLFRISDAELTQLAGVPDQKIVCSEVTEGELVLAAVIHWVRTWGKGRSKDRNNSRMLYWVVWLLVIGWFIALCEIGPRRIAVLSPWILL